jgi:D-3-phosphoglycerate dehydrogenase/C-terminal binding protein
MTQAERPVSSLPRVVIADFIRDDLAPEKQVLAGQATVEALDAHHEDELIGRIDDADAIMLYHHLTLTRKTIQRLTRCKLIVRCGVGVDNVDWRFAAQRGIAVANVPDYGTEEVADSAIGMMLALTRGIHYLNSILRAGQGTWHYSQTRPLRRLRGRTFAIVGLGRIGSAAALRAKALGMRVLFYDPPLPDGYDKVFGIERVDTLQELLAQAHVLSLHCPLLPETRHLINEKTLAWLPRGSYLINTARGGVIDASLIPDALASGHLAGAGIDVLEDEPPGQDDPLLAAWRDPNHPCHHRLILNPHSAFYCEEGLMDMRIKGARACLAAIRGEPVRNVINGVEMRHAW